MLHIIVGKRTNEPTFKMANTPANIKYHTPLRKGYSWWIIDAETNEVIDSYIVPAKIKQQVCTPRIGAWCNCKKGIAQHA